MRVILDFYKAIYFRFKTIFIKFDGNNNNTHFSSILLLSIFNMLFYLLCSMALDIHWLQLIPFGPVGVVILSFLLAVLNWWIIGDIEKMDDSRFIIKGKPRIAVDLFIVTIIIATFCIALTK